MGCRRCNLATSSLHTCIHPRGAESPIVLFVGEAPGKIEDQSGLPFLGAAGKKLDEFMSRAGLDPAICRWTDIVRCVPWKERNRTVRSPNDFEIDMCCKYLEEEILRVSPVFIVPVGASAGQYFTGNKKITQIRGRRHAAELPTVRYRYIRMLEVLRDKGIDVSELETVKVSARESAINKACKKYDYVDIPTKQYTIFPTMSPAAILYGNRTAEHDILADMNHLASQISGEDKSGDYRMLTTVEDIRNVLQRLTSDYVDGKYPYLSFDVETSSLDMFDPKETLTTIGIAAYEDTGWFIPFEHVQSPFKGDRLALKAISGMFSQMFEKVPALGHNIKFDYKWAYMRDIFIKEIGEDTELQSWTLFNDQLPHDLESLTSKFTNLLLHKQEMKEAMDAFPKEEKYDTNNYDLGLLCKYNCGDVDSCVRLAPVFKGMMEREGLYEAHRKVAVPAVIPTAEMEINGCVVDLDFVETLRQTMGSEIAEYYDRFDRWGLKDLMESLITTDEERAKGKKKEFKLSSAEQVSTMLFDVLELEPKKYGKVRKVGKWKGQKIPSADKKSVQELLEDVSEKLAELKDKEGTSDYEMWKLRYNVLDTIRDFKTVHKLYSSYVTGLPKHVGVDGYVRPHYGIRHTATGRYNCKDPALQTIPWHSVIKQMFTSRFQDGVILSADFSQMELRVFAMETGDEEMIRCFVEGRDIHSMIAARVLKCPEDEVPTHERRRIKTINFGLLYGRGPKAIAAQEGMTQQEAQAIIDSVFSEFSKIKGFIKEAHQFVRKHGYVKYINGFRRIIPRDDEGGKDQRQAVNSKIQGPASDLGVGAMINAQNTLQRLNFQSKLYQFVHDSIGYDVPPGELFELVVILKKEMESKIARTFPFVTVPLKVDFEIGVSWGHLLEAKVMDNRRLKFEGKKEFFKPLLQRMKSWESYPKLVSLEHHVKEEPKVVRSLLKTSGLEEMIEVPYVKAVVEFPRFQRVPPVYTRPPFKSIKSALKMRGDLVSGG